MNKAKTFCLKNWSIVAGVALASLALMDVFFQWRSSHEGNLPFVRGISNPEAPQTIITFLLLGMVVGMVGGIALSFAYFMWKEKKLASCPDDFQTLLDELSREESFHSGERPAIESEERGETLEPWERSSDWWKGEDDK